MYFLIIIFIFVFQCCPTNAQDEKISSDDMIFLRFTATHNQEMGGMLLKGNNENYKNFVNAAFSKDNNEKIKLYTKFIENKPTYGLSKAFQNRGVTYLENEELQKSISDLDSSIVLDNREAYSFYFRGVAYFSTNENYEKALKDLNQSIVLDKTLIMSYYMRASVYVELKEYNKALEDLNLVIKNEPGFAEAYLQTGTVYFHLNQYDKAKEYFDIAESKKESLGKIIDFFREQMKNEK